jgi:hypothetical protein
MSPIKNGLKQGEALQPLIFNSALEYIIRRVQVTQGWLEINGYTSPSSVCRWCSYILGGTVSIIKKNTETLVVASNLSTNASCRQPFRELNILPVPSQYILSVFLFVTKNKDQFMTNSQTQRITTRQTSDLYIPTAHLTMYQKVVNYQRIKIYNHLPKTIKDLSGDKINLN